MVTFIMNDISYFVFFFSSFVYTPVSDCIAIMQAGSELIKLRAPSRQFHRIFLLSEDHREIKWRPSSKKAERARGNL